VLFITGVSYGYFGVELSSGAGRTGRVITTEGPCFHWPWMQIRLVSQEIVTSARTLKYRSSLGTPVKVRYSVQFRASPDIEDFEGRNRFVEWADDDPPFSRIKDQIEQRLEIDFGWICRQVSAEDLLQSREPLELFGQCVLKLKTPPHENESFTQTMVRDTDLVKFYIANKERILNVHQETRLRPILALLPGRINSGRYCGQAIGADGRIANPRFHAELSDTERLLGIEILDFQVAIDCSPLFLLNGQARLGS
jgi:hypothetical protein